MVGWERGGGRGGWCGSALCTTATPQQQEQHANQERNPCNKGGTAVALSAAVVVVVVVVPDARIKGGPSGFVCPSTKSDSASIGGKLSARAVVGHNKTRRPCRYLVLRGGRRCFAYISCWVGISSITSNSYDCSSSSPPQR